MTRTRGDDESYTRPVQSGIARHLSVVPPPDSPGGRLHRVYNSAEPLDAIAAVEELRADLDAQQRKLVVAARAAGITWEAIGAAVATTRQGAFNRFGAPVQRDEVAGLLGQMGEGGEAVDDTTAKRLSAAIVEQTGRAPRSPKR